MSERPPYRLPRDVVPEHYTLVLEPDLALARFDGEVTIHVNVVEATPEVVLNAAELEIASAEIRPGRGQEGTGRPATVRFVPEEEQVVLQTDEPLRPGPWQLHLRFSGQLNDKLRGFYRSKYKQADGSDGWLAVTQFESTDARRAFPCWDEPEFKATFGISIVADEDLTVLSNGHELNSEPVGNGRRRVTFADTIKMSTYLVAVAVGPFQLTDPVEVDGTPVRVGYVPGRQELTGLATRAAAHALDFLRKYFSIPYPADKLDHIAVPDFAAGAMENLGLVTYRETALLVPDDSAQAEQQRVVSVVAHETAHMWFGDLVTMRWWEGIWLNEAFATFMEILATDAFEPKWEIWADFGVDRVAALATDSLRSSRPIEYPVGRPEEAEDMFDILTYEKGGSVLRMIERYLGDSTFRQGLSYYLDKHRLGNTVTTDLWDALEHVSGQPITATMGTWVNQAGHPVVSVELDETGTGLRLAQSRFLLDGGSDDAQQWFVPVTVRYGTEDGTIEREHFLLEGSSATMTLKSRPRWLVANEGAWGVYRSRYSEDLRQRLFSHLDQLDERERLSLVADTWLATVAGLVPLDVPVQLWGLLSYDRGHDLWWTVSNGLGLLGLVCDESELEGVRRLTRELAGPNFRSLGWEPEPGGLAETPRLNRLRARLITLLGSLGGDGEVRAEARRRLAEADDGGRPVPPDLATAVAHVVAAGGGAAEWDVLYAHYKEAKTPQDETRYLMALAGFRQPELLERSIDLLFSGEVRLQDAPFLLGALLGQRESTVLAWEAVEAHWQQMARDWPARMITRSIEGLPGLAAGGAEMAERAVKWLDDHPIGLGARRLAQATERLRINVKFGQRISDELSQLLASYSAGGTRSGGGGPGSGGPGGGGPGGGGPGGGGPGGGGPQGQAR